MFVICSFERKLVLVLDCVFLHYGEQIFEIW